VVGCGDTDSVDGAVGEDLSEIFDLFGLMATAAGDGSGTFEVWLIHVANCTDGDARLLHRRFEILRAHYTNTDERRGDSIVGCH
jgi:hypothetical protein